MQVIHAIDAVHAQTLPLDELRSMVAGIDIDQPIGFERMTPLAHAARIGCPRAVELLLELGANKDWISPDGVPVLSWAIYGGDGTVIDLLVAAGADLAPPETFGTTYPKHVDSPVAAAAWAGQVERLQWLLDQGVDPDSRNNKGRIALHSAIRNQQNEAAALLCAHTRVLETEEGSALLRGAFLGMSVGYPIRATIDALLAGGARCTAPDALQYAIQAGHADGVRLCIEAGADPNGRYITANKPHSPLSVATCTKTPVYEVVEALLDAGADPNHLDNRRCTPLRYAASNHPDTRIAELLIARGARLDRGQSMWSALHQAARRGSVPFARCLLEHGADLEERTVHDLTALQIAANDGQREMLDFLIAEGADIDGGAFTPLMAAAYRGRTDLVRALLELGADTHKTAANAYTDDTTPRTAQQHAELAGQLDTAVALARVSGEGFTTLMGAVLADDLGSIRARLEAGDDVEATEPSLGDRPLHRAGSVLAVTLLLDAGADIEAVNSHGATPLIRQAGDVDIVSLLLARGADARAVDNKLCSALHYAARAGSVPALRALLEAGGDLGPTKRYVETPLHAAVESNQPEVVAYLCERGANPNTWMTHHSAKMTPLSLAATANHLACAEILLAHGAKSNKRDNDKRNQDFGGFTPLHWAAWEGHAEVFAAMMSRSVTGMDTKNNNGRSPVDLAQQHPRCASLVRGVLDGRRPSEVLAEIRGQEHRPR